MTTTVHPTYLDPKTLDRIKRLDVRARLVVEGFITGQHRSPYNGSRSSSRPIANTRPATTCGTSTGRSGRRPTGYYIKEYEEETNLKCTIMLDAAKSMEYGEGLEQVRLRCHLRGQPGVLAAAAAGCGRAW